MTTETLFRPDAPVAVDCPWCGEPVEVDPQSPVLRCQVCATEIDFAPEALEDAPATVAVVGAAA